MSSQHQDSGSDLSISKAKDNVTTMDHNKDATHNEVVDSYVDVEEVQQPAWSRVREYCQDGFSEFLGTFILLLFGDGVVAQVVLSGGEKGNYLSICWGWG